VLSYDVESGEAAPMGGTLPSDGPYDYVIVTSSTLESSFQPLVNQKISKGLTAGIVTTDYIYANFTGTEGGDNPDKIRDFLREAYTTWGTQWVLLGGDTDVVPHRGAYGYVSSVSGPIVDNDIPTDIYFACLDGPWNSDSDGIWGESNDGSGGGDIDLVPDVYIGRAPVSNTTEATNFVNKTVAYETTPHSNLYSGVWLGEQLDASTWGGYKKEIIKNNQIPSTWTLTERYEKDAAWSGSDFINDLNASPHIVNHDGHANEYSNANLSRTDVDNLTNDDPYVMYSVGCYSGAFDVSDCIAEHHVKGANGAVAVVMNSRYGWYQRGNNSDGPSFRYDRDFWDAIFNEGKDQFGEAQHDSKMENLGSVGSTGAYRWLHFCITLFGDPETSLAQPPPGAHAVELDPGEVETGVDFGNKQDLEPSIDAGDHLLQADQAGQLIEVYVTGGEAVEGLNFRIRIGDGIDPTPSPAPKIPDDDAVDLVGTAANPTIFYSNHTTPRDLDDPDQSDYYEAAAISTDHDTVSAEGLLAIVEIDTTGVTTGQWDLILRDPGGFSTSFVGPSGTIYPDLVVGSIKINERGGEHQDQRAARTS